MLSTPDLLQLSALQLAEGYLGKRFQPIDVINELAQYTKAANADVNAFLTLNFDEALAAAKRSSNRWECGTALSPLDGVPVSIKENVPVKGWTSRYGVVSPDLSVTAHEDAPAVARLREAGAIMFGHTTMPEFAWKAAGESRLTGITRNPWNLEKTSGGSSSGAAAAVAAFMGPLALGTDGGGSVRGPAAFCGVFGLKPSGGRIPSWPPGPHFRLGHPGPISREVSDSATILTVMSKPDVRDWQSLPFQNIDYARDLDKLPEQLSIAFSPKFGGLVDVQTEVMEVVEEAILYLMKDGLNIIEHNPEFENPSKSILTLFNVGLATASRHINDDGLMQLEEGLRKMIQAGKSTSGLDLSVAILERTMFGGLMRQFSSKYPILITPVFSHAAFDTGLVAPPGMGYADWDRWAFTHYFNATLQPAATVPVGITKSGLPVSLQVVGPMFDDHLVLKFARRIEKLFSFSQKNKPTALFG